MRRLERERERERERGRLCVCKKARKKEPCESLSFVLKYQPLSLALTRYTLVYIPSTATSDQPLLTQSLISSHAATTSSSRTSRIHSRIYIYIYIYRTLSFHHLRLFFLLFHFLNPSSRLCFLSPSTLHQLPFQIVKSLLYNLFVSFLIESYVDQKNSTIDFTVTISNLFFNGFFLIETYLLCCSFSHAYK